MSAIGTAFVAVRPDLTDFKVQLLKDLEKATKVPVAARTISLRASFEVGTKEKLTAQLAKMGSLPVLVKAVLDDTSVAVMQKKIGAIANVPLAGSATGKVNVSPVLDQRGIVELTQEMAALPPIPFDAIPVINTRTARANLAEQMAVLGNVPVSVSAVAGSGSGNAAKRSSRGADQFARATTAADQASIQAGKALETQVGTLAEAEAVLKVATTAEKLETEAATLAKTNATAVVLGLRKEMEALAVTRRRDAELQVQELSTLNATAAAEASLARAAAARGGLADAGKNASGAKSRANEINKAADQAELASAEAVKRTRESGVQTLILMGEEQDAITQGAVREQRARAASVLEGEKQLGIEAAIRRVQELRADAVISPLGATPFQAAKHAALEAAAAEKLATKALLEYEAAGSAASAENVDRLRTEQALARQLRISTGIQFEKIKSDLASAKASDAAAAAAARQTAAEAGTRSQVIRGTAATSASFLGLRGAVLSASTGFLAATVAVTGLAKIVSTAEGLQRQLNILESVSGATAEQMHAIDEEARALGADLKLPATSATDAAEAMTELVKAGLSVNDTLEATRGVLQLSAAAGLDNVDAAKIVATQLNAFALSGDQAARVVDLLAGASIAAQGEISDFSLAFQQVAAVAHQVGLPVETATAILTQFAKAGIRGSDAGTSLRTMLLRLVPTTKAAAEAQAELGVHIDRSIPIGQQFTDLVDQYTVALAKLGPVAQQEALTNIFGQDAIRGASISLTKGSQALRDIQAQVTETGSAARITEGRVEGLSGSVEGLKSEVETLGATVGTSLLPLLDSLAHTFGAVATNVNTVAGGLQSIANISIKPLGNLLGGTDALATGGVALAAAGLGRKLIRDRADQKALVAADAGFLKLKERILSLEITQEESNALFKIMGITAEEAAEGAARAQSRVKTAVADTNLLIERQQLAFAALAEVEAGSSATIAGTQAATTARVAAEEAVGAAAVESGVARVAANDLATKSLQGEQLALFDVQAGYIRTAKVAVTANATIAASNAAVSAGQLSLFGTEAAAAGKLARAKGLAGRAGAALGGRGISGAGLGVGIAASLIGSQIPGPAGNILGAAGTGATFGSFLGVPGAIAGAALFGAGAVLTESKAATKRKQEKLKAEFQAMTPEEQRDLIAALFPDKANQNIQNDIASLVARTRTTRPTRVNPRGTVETAADFIESQGGLNAEDQKTLDEFKAQQEKIRAAAEVVARQSLIIPDIANLAQPVTEGFRSGNQQLAESRHAADDFFTTLTGFAKIPVPEGSFDKITAAIHKATQGELQLALVNAQLSGSKDEEGVALEALADANQKEINRIERLLTQQDPKVPLAAKFKVGTKAYDELITELNKAKGKQLELNKAQQDFLVAQLNQVPLGQTLAAIQAGASVGKADDLASALTEQARANAAVAKGVALFNRGGIDQDSLDALKVNQAQAAAGVVSAQQTLIDSTKQKADDAKKKAEDAAKIRIDALQFLADKAGNVGKAEDNLLAALKAQLAKAKVGTAEFNAARSALDAEQQKHMQAIIGIATARGSLRDARTNLLLDIAKSTPGLGDDRQVLNRQIADDKRDIVAIQARIKSEHAKGAALLALQQAIVDERADIFSKQQEIKDLTGGSGGFSLQDLFKESINQLATFGSNVSTAPRTAGQQRGDFAGTLIQSILGNKQDRQELGISTVAAETKTTNEILREILVAVRRGPGSTGNGVDTKGEDSGLHTARFAKNFAAGKVGHK